jgi:hypothetical protein
VTLPLGAILDWTMGTPAGFAAFRHPKVNAALKKILTAWCDYLNSPESLYVLNDSPSGWTSDAARRAIGIEQYDHDPADPHWGFTSWNDFFTRRFRDGARPVAAPEDDDVIVAACESTPFSIRSDVKRRDEFWLKTQPYSLEDMLANDEAVEEFVGGTVYVAERRETGRGAHGPVEDGAERQGHVLVAELGCHRQDLVDQTEHLVRVLQVPLAVRAGLGHLSDHPVHVHADHRIGGDQALEFHHRRVEFDVLALGLDPSTVAGEPLFQGVLAGRQPTALTSYVSSETALGHVRNLAAALWASSQKRCLRHIAMPWLRPRARVAPERKQVASLSRRPDRTTPVSYDRAETGRRRPYTNQRSPLQGLSGHRNLSVVK